MHVGPVTVSQSIKLCQLAMRGEVDDFFGDEADAVVVLNQVYLLLVVYHKQGLLDYAFLFVLFLDALTICLKSHQPATSKLVDFFLVNLVSF